MDDVGYQNNERFILIQCFNDNTAIIYVPENHIIKTLDPFSLLITLPSNVTNIWNLNLSTQNLIFKNTRGIVIIILGGPIEKLEHP